MRNYLTGYLAAFALFALAAVGMAFAADYPVPQGIWTTGDVLTARSQDGIGKAPVGYVGQMKVYSQTITPASVATIVCAEQTFTVTGLVAATDKVLYNPPATGNATSAAQVRVSADNTLAVMYCNPTAGALTPGAGTATIIAYRVN